MCWNGFCIAGDCDGEQHIDVTGYTWREKRGETYCIQHDRYDDCEN